MVFSETMILNDPLLIEFVCSINSLNTRTQ